MKKKSLLMLMVITVLVIGTIQIQPTSTSQSNDLVMTEAPEEVRSVSGFDSENISIILLNPANQSTVSGTFDIELNITSDYDLLNLTLFVEDEIYPDYNNTLTYNSSLITTVSVNVSIDTTLVAEGLLNFTFLFQNSSIGMMDNETYHLDFLVDNHGAPTLEVIAPTTLDILSGITDLYINVTTDYAEVFLNVTVDGELLEDYNATLIPAGVGNYSINGSSYENGFHSIHVIVYTEEGLTDTKTIEVEFLDHVRFTIVGLSNYDSIAGTVEFSVRTFTPYDEVTMSIYVDDVISTDVVNETMSEGTDTLSFDASLYSEGEHNVTFKAYDAFGHMWEFTIILVVDNHGIPTIQFVTPDNDIVLGYTTFTIDIDTTWANVVVTVYVDDVAVVGYTNLTTPAGTFTFSLDTNLYSDAEHTLKIVVNTDEGEEAEVTQIFGFANLKIEEVLSLGLLIGIAIFIPLFRKKNGQPIKGVLVLDLIFGAVIIGLFLLLGVTSFSYAMWHLNLGSIWMIGVLLVFANWAFPFLSMDTEE